MSFEQQNKIYLEVIKHLDDLNELLRYYNLIIDARVLTDNLNMKKYDLNSDDVNTLLSSLLIYVFTLTKDVIKISKEKNINLIIVNFINTVLEEQKFEEILYEVI